MDLGRRHPAWLPKAASGCPLLPRRYLGSALGRRIHRARRPPLAEVRIRHRQRAGTESDGGLSDGQTRVRGVVQESDAAQALKRALAERHIEPVRAILTRVAPDEAFVVLDQLSVGEQADLVDLLGPDELLSLMPRSTPDDDVSSTAAELDLEPRQFLRLLRMLGPGLITGASDDDPSGIATYSVAGAQFGFATLWTALVTFPLLAAVQYACAKIGFATGMGLAGVLRQHYPSVLVYPCVLGLLIANTITAGADLGAIGAALNLLVPGVPTPVFVAPIGLSIVAPQLCGPFWLIARVFKWLTISL